MLGSGWRSELADVLPMLFVPLTLHIFTGHLLLQDTVLVLDFLTLGLHARRDTVINTSYDSKILPDWSVWMIVS